jgi:hypothetical protein
MVRNSSAFVLAAVALGLTVDAAPVSAQTFEACRVPSVGVIYMVNVGDAPAACLDPSHVPFTWTEGGAPPDGSITTAKLENGAVTPAKIAPGAVVQWKSAGYGLVNLNTTALTTTNLTSLSVNAPVAGSVYVNSSGYCNTSPGATQFQMNVGWGTAATTQPSVAGGAAYILHPAGSPAGGGAQVPYASAEVFGVAAGTTTLYFNAHNFSGGSASCAGTNLLIFSAAQLP